jgi:uncharacterized repeat protein (TIGR02543 family)
MILIYAKDSSFMMGLSKAELHSNEIPTPYANYGNKHKASFTYDFYIDSTMIIQADFKKIMGYNPSSQLGDSLPVENLTWFDAVLYCNARSRRDSLDSVYTYTSISRSGKSASYITGLTYNIRKNGYRLPTNAEYEYTERAGTKGLYFFSLTEATSVNNGKPYTWSKYNSGFNGSNSINTKKVATKKPNPWGVYDLVGNDFEWVNDWDSPYPTRDEVDPLGGASSPDGMRVAKGGSYRTDIEYHMRIAYHYKWNPNSITPEIGFRCVRTKVESNELVSKVFVTPTSNTIVIAKDSGELSLKAFISPYYSSNKSISWSMPSTPLASLTVSSTDSTICTIKAFDQGVVTVTANSVENPLISASFDITIKFTFNVTFNVNGGSVVSTIVTSIDTTITEPKAPVKRGYIFSGWYKDAAYNNAWDFTTDVVTANITLYAKWIASTSIEQSKTGDFKLSPNPATSTLKVDNLPQHSEIDIFSMDGKIIKELKIEVSESTIDIGNLPKGIYFLRVINKDGSVLQKFIKQ